MPQFITRIQDDRSFRRKSKRIGGGNRRLLLNGASASGTFSAVFNLDNGDMESITDGSFDVPISM